MKVHLESTSKVVELVLDGRTLPARLWEGHTEKGVPCHAYITRIAVGREQDAAEFERDLQEQRTPSPEMQGSPCG